MRLLTSQLTLRAPQKPHLIRSLTLLTSQRSHPSRSRRYHRSIRESPCWERATCASEREEAWQECWTPTEVVHGGRGRLSAASARCVKSLWSTPFAASGYCSSRAAMCPTKRASTSTSRSSSRSTARRAMRHWAWIQAEEGMCWTLVRDSTVVRAPNQIADARPPFREAK
jgi:hypothetical protein